MMQTAKVSLLRGDIVGLRHPLSQASCTSRCGVGSSVVLREAVSDGDCACLYRSSVGDVCGGGVVESGQPGPRGTCRYGNSTSDMGCRMQACTLVGWLAYDRASLSRSTVRVPRGRVPPFPRQGSRVVRSCATTLARAPIDRCTSRRPWMPRPLLPEVILPRLHPVINHSRLYSCSRSFPASSSLSLPTA